jgi:cytochrome c-type biogenesis protein CcmE
MTRLYVVCTVYCLVQIEMSLILYAGNERIVFYTSVHNLICTSQDSGWISSILGHALVMLGTAKTIYAQWRSLTFDYAVTSNTLFEFQSAMHELQCLV